MRCDQCRHWQGDEHEWEAERAGFRKCEAVRPRWIIMDEAGEKRVADVDQRVEALKASCAYVQDGSEYRADLFTGPDFFCALFEPIT